MISELAKLFEVHGSRDAVSGHAPKPFVGPDSVWLVTQGHVDMAAVAVRRDGEQAGFERTHLLRVPTGQLIFSVQDLPQSQNLLIMGYGSGDTQVARIELSRLISAAREEPMRTAVAAAVDRWIEAIQALCVDGTAPRGAQSLTAGATHRLEAGQSAQADSGVIWVRPIDGVFWFFGEASGAPIGGDLLLPLGKDAWLTSVVDCTLECRTSASVELEDAYWRGLEAFHRAIASCIELERQRRIERSKRRVGARSEEDRSTLAAAYTELGSVLHPHQPRLGGDLEGGSALVSACRLVGRHLGIDVHEPLSGPDDERHTSPLEEIAWQSGFAFRRVTLRDGWFRRDGGPLLGFTRDTDTPVALLPTSSKAYDLHDVVEDTVQPVTPGLAQELSPNAFAFYRTLPDRPLRGRDLLRFSWHGVWNDLWTVGVIGAFGGLLSLVVPIVIGYVFDVVIPDVERRQLTQIVLGLIVVAFAGAGFEMSRNIALIRLKHRAGDGLQAAIWERTLNLPARFFGKYSAGDLGSRAMGIESIMEELSASVIATIISSIFSLFAIGLLFYFSPVLALVAIGLVLVMVLMIVLTGALQLRYERRIEEHSGLLAGMLLQFMNGMTKLRVAAVEHRAFYQWAKRYASQNRLAMKSAILDNRLDAFLAFFPVLSAVVIFWLVANRGDSTETALTTGSFLAFVAAFGMLEAGLVDLGSTIVGLLEVVPSYERLQPILVTQPERHPAKADPGRLRGRLEVSNLSFQYESNGPLVLDRVSFEVQPGDFVAIVGPSGAGKSTLLRLLLGFEQPISGTVLYDGLDASGLDQKRLRRQLGVILQDGDLLPGDIFTNIVGSAADLTVDDAWEAVRLAGLDATVEQMPMGMHTIITGGAGTLSGGEQQRLLIARAMVTKPRILLFDEATSALDNPTQAVVTEGLRRLRATRVVIAHRLSTIADADRIFVLDRGRIVQQGSYDALLRRPGLFRDLAERQTL